MKLFPFILAALATYRATRLITGDMISERFRDWVESRSEMFGYLVSCDWCTSIWLAPLPALSVVLWPTNRVVLIILTALSLSALTGFLHLVENRLDIPDK